MHAYPLLPTNAWEIKVQRFFLLLNYQFIDFLGDAHRFIDSAFSNFSGNAQGTI